MFMPLSRHYAVRVDGCGLELENRLRRSFQMFVQRLIDLTKFSKALERFVGHVTVM